MDTYHAAHWSSDPSRYSSSEEEEECRYNIKLLTHIKLIVENVKVGTKSSGKCENGNQVHPDKESNRHSCLNTDQATTIICSVTPQATNITTIKGFGGVWNWLINRQWQSIPNPPIHITELNTGVIFRVDPVGSHRCLWVLVWLCLCVMDGRISRGLQLLKQECYQSLTRQALTNPD